MIWFVVNELWGATGFSPRPSPLWKSTFQDTLSLTQSEFTRNIRIAYITVGDCVFVFCFFVPLPLNLSVDPPWNQACHSEPDYQRAAGAAWMQLSLHCGFLWGLLQWRRDQHLYGAHGKRHKTANEIYYQGAKDLWGWIAGLCLALVQWNVGF